MGINRVIVLGSGPIGLLCAIEAKRYFNDVWIIEKRPSFTRLNVPQINDKALLDHVVQWDPLGKLPRPEPGAHLGSIKQIEKTLLEQAVARGVTIMRPYIVQSVQGDGPTSEQVSGDIARKSGSEKKPHRYKRIRLTYQQWDDKGKKPDVRTRPHVLGGVDLLVVATGGGAIDDKLVTEKLGFTYEKLKAENYMAYGVFEPSNEQDRHPHKDAMEDIFGQIAGNGAISFETGKRKSVDLQYFLPSLAGITAKDFNNLKGSRALLKRLLVALKAGHGMSDGVLESIKDVEKNMLAFKIQIQRAQQFYSPNYPAVLVGDAAVTPHPDSGMGLTSGFRGFEEMKALFEALAKTTDPDDELMVYQSFNNRYELHVSKKALDGTTSIIQNLAHLCDRYATELNLEKSRGLVNAFGHTATRMKELESNLKAHERVAQRLSRNKPSVDELISFDVHETLGQLWSDLAVTYAEVKQVTEMVTLLDGRIEAIEKLIAAQ